MTSASHVKAWRTRKARERMGRDLITREIALEVDGRPVPRQRRRFTAPQPALMLVQRAEQPAPRIATAPLVMIAASLLVALGVAIKAGFFDWRPGDQAVSTIDYSAAPHLQPLKGIQK